MDAFNLYFVKMFQLLFISLILLSSKGIRSEKLVNKYWSWSSVLEIPLKSPHKLMGEKWKTLANCNLHGRGYML